MKYNIIYVFLFFSIISLLFVSCVPTGDNGNNNVTFGHVYVESNSTNNMVYDFFRDPINGKLIFNKPYPTGGNGSNLYDTNARAVIVSGDGNWLFVANSGDSSFSVFSVGLTGLTQVGPPYKVGYAPVSIGVYELPGQYGPLYNIYVASRGGLLNGQTISPSLYVYQLNPFNTPTTVTSISSINLGNNIPNQIAVTIINNNPFLFLSTKDSIFSYSINTSTGATSLMASMGALNNLGFSVADISSNSNRILYIATTSGTTSNMNSYIINNTGSFSSNGNPSLIALPNLQYTIANVRKNDIYATISNATASALVAFIVNINTGALTSTNFSDSTQVGVNQPSEVRFSSDGLFIYVLNRGNNTISVYNVTNPTPLSKSLVQTIAIPNPPSGGIITGLAVVN